MRRASGRSGFLFLAALAGIAALSPGAAGAGDFTGVRGWATWNDNTAAGVVVYAYRDFDRGFPGDSVAVSAPTAADGSYSLELPAGSYILAAARTADGGPRELRPGDAFCFFGGNPVRVDPGRATAVGFRMSIVADDPVPDPSPGVSGTVYDERGDPLSGATVYLYRSSADGFKGMPGQFARTQKDGTFLVRIRKGTFFVIARKRESGDLFGPTLPGDRFGYYPRNPVVLAEGERRGIRIDAFPRQAVEKKFGEGYERPEGIVVRIRTIDPEGRPMSGVRVLAYRAASMTGFPAFVSAKTGAEGSAELFIPEGGRYYLLARERLGGPANGEWYGKYAGSPDHSVSLSPGREASGPLTIVLDKR